MKKQLLLTTAFSLLMLPMLGHAQARYTTNGPYECQPIKQDDPKPSARKLTDAELKAQSNIYDTMDLNGDGQLEKVTFTTQSISKEAVKTTVTVQDSAGYETIVHSNIMDGTMVDPVNVIGAVLVNGKSYVRIIMGKDAYLAFDISYQGRGKFSACRLSNALNIRNDMRAFYMKAYQQ